MLKLIGGAVVCGFALYGLVIYLDRTKSKAVVAPADAAQVVGTEGSGAEIVGERVSSPGSSDGARAVG
ncbi:hypothetical protein [Lysobacter auxotrophicus]|uniref:Uncharacterized protein n=1 Tax=Lysobacter auxotrophicus TaxID=2992573 RepID=A0ABN6UNX0_9GAMM|nr:hypothetical protein [Lysobacter auxotrophicus]BDU18092.1 hypothetical protein LA521A_32930 [Lysobacter auxotrophicus]